MAKIEEPPKPLEHIWLSGTEPLLCGRCNQAMYEGVIVEPCFESSPARRRRLIDDYPARVPTDIDFAFGGYPPSPPPPSTTPVYRAEALYGRYGIGPQPLPSQEQVSGASVADERRALVREIESAMALEHLSAPPPSRPRDPDDRDMNW